LNPSTTLRFDNGVNVILGMFFTYLSIVAFMVTLFAGCWFYEKCRSSTDAVVASVDKPVVVNVKKAPVFRGRSMSI